MRSCGGVSAQAGVPAMNRARASGVVEPGRMRLEPGVADVATERRIGREGDAMTRGLQRPCERNHRMEMAVTDHAGEEDLHLAEASSGSLSLGPIATPVRRQSA